jgi:SHS2 domain-containing protein
MFSLMVSLDTVSERESRDIQVTARHLPGLLVGWLSELLYFVDAEEVLFCRFEVDELSATRLVARAFGEPIDRGRHDLHLGIKAVTRHMLDISDVPGGYEARILFDI